MIEIIAGILGFFSFIALFILVTFSRKYPPRMNIELTELQVRGLNRLAYGERTAVFSALVNRVNELLDNNPDKRTTIVAAITEGHVGLKELIRWR